MKHYDILYPVLPQAKRKAVLKPADPPDELIAEISIRLESLMRISRPYLKTAYSLQELGADISVPYHLVSWYLNRKAGLRFNDYINQYRVDYFKELVQQGELRNTTLQGVARKCGFSNRNTLAMAFKRFTGMTPSEFMRTQV